MFDFGVILWWCVGYQFNLVYYVHNRYYSSLSCRVCDMFVESFDTLSNYMSICTLPPSAVVTFVYGVGTKVVMGWGKIHTRGTVWWCRRLCVYLRLGWLGDSVSRNRSWWVPPQYRSPNPCRVFEVMSYKDWSSQVCSYGPRTTVRGFHSRTSDPPYSNRDRGILESVSFTEVTWVEYDVNLEVYVVSSVFVFLFVCLCKFPNRKSF